jgi:putative nucleotidyltransferase with HDIG domain
MITREEIETTLTELLDLIKDKDLRGKVIDAWMLGIERGGWDSMDKLRKAPFTLVTETRGIGFIEHTIAVTKGAIGLARAQMENYSKMPYEIDMDRLVAGGLLHDAGKLLEIKCNEDGTYCRSHSGYCERHPVSGAILAAEAGLSEEIVNIIACHAKEGEGRPQVIETQLIHQADFATFNPLVMMTKDLLIL